MKPAWVTSCLLLAAVVFVVGGGRAYGAVTLQKSSGGDVYTGGTLTFTVAVTRVGVETNLVLHDVTPAGLTLGTLTAGSAMLDCTTTPSGALGPSYTVTCNAGGELQVKVADGAANPPPIVVSYRTPSTAATITNNVTATCSGGCAPAPMSSATAMVVAPSMTVTKTGPPNVKPGGAIAYAIVAGNTGALPLSSWAADDALPAGTTLVDVTIGGATFTAAQLSTPRTAPDGATVSASGNAIHVVGPMLQPSATYGFTIGATANASDAANMSLVNVAKVTPLGMSGATVSSSPVTTTVQMNAVSLALAKRVAPSAAKIGDTVTYTLTVTPAGAVAGPLTLVDALDPALKLAALKLDGQAVACGASPVTSGDFTVTCGANGRTPTVALNAGAMLATPVGVDLQTTILPSAGAQIQNTATLTDANGATQSAMAPLTISNASTTGASIALTSSKVTAAKDDQVTFVADIGVPSAAKALSSPSLVVTPSKGLRVSDVRVTAASGMTTVVKPTQSGATLTIPLGAIVPGGAVSVQIRTRLNGRAAVDSRETLAAQLLQGSTALGSATAGVRVIAEPDFDLGTILGDVFRDDNGNGVRDRGEPGIGNALVVMDDGLQSLTDNAGRYHLAAVAPGDRAVKLAEHTLPPGSKLTTDVTRIVPVTPGALVKIDFGVKVPAPEPPIARPLVSTALPELRLSDAGKLIYRLYGSAAPGAQVRVDGRGARVDKQGGWSIDVMLAHGRTRLVIVTEFGDGRVVVSTRDVFWVDRAEGGSLILPRADEPRLTLRFPSGALAEPTFQLEGATTFPLTSLAVAGQPLHADAQGRFALKLRVPESGAGIAVDCEFNDGVAAKFDHLLAANGNFMLLVGLAEGKIGYVQSTGAGTGGGLYAQGRVKLYAKGRILGRWLLEGGIDIDTSQLDSWRDLFRGDPTRIFRNLDPDRFYTVYGDSSQTTQAAQSRARLYVRIQIDRSELLFGNLQTGLTGVELGRYSRSVTGGRLEFVRAGDDPNAPPSTQVILFGAWLQTQRAHDELRGTGGSLYYLSHRSVVEGSEQVRIEIRDKVSDRPMANSAQRATVDYEVDYLAGRIILRDPLSSVAPSPTLVRSGNVDGDRSFIVVDYEYIIDQDSDDGSIGARAAQKLGPVRLGGTVVNEFRAGGNYTLLGGDVQFDLKKYGVIIGEYAHSYGALTSFSRSDDGGLTYTDALGTTPAQAGNRQGNAYKAEADLHFGGVNLRPYFRGIDQGYTDTAHAQDAGFMQWGVDSDATFWGFALRLHYDERRYQQTLVYDAMGNPITTANETRRDIGGEIGRRFGRVDIRLGARSERADDPDPSRAGHRTAIAARVEVRIVPRLSLYGLAQYDVEKGGGDGTALIAKDNSLGALGAIVHLPWQTNGTLEGSYGAQGVGGLVSVKSEMSPGRVLYGTFTMSQDRDDRVSTIVAAGGRQRIADKSGNARATLYAEDQFRDGPLYDSDAAGSRAHMQTAGVDVPIGKRFVLGSTFERGEVTPSGTPLANSPPIDRTAATLYGSYGGDKLRAQVKGELRADDLPSTTAPGETVSEMSWLVQAMLTARPHPDVTLRAKFFMSQANGTSTLGAGTSSALANSTEASAGFSWRPSFTDRVVLLGKYTYLDEGVPSAQAQNGPIDPATGQPLTLRERAHAMSLAADGRVIWRFSLGEKIAAKYRQELDPGGPTAAWLVLWINRVTFHVTRAWDALAEYRLLFGPGPALNHGVAVEVNRIIVGHLRLGAGWNFTSFSDDETRLGDGSENGFFIRAQGFY